MEKLKFNSQLRPKENPHDWDAHIYFEENQIDIITELKEKIINKFDEKRVFVGNIFPYPIGPHTLPMLEINFGENDFQEVVLFLVKHRSKLNILVHSISESDYLDHTEGAIWLGQTVPLKLELFSR